MGKKGQERARNGSSEENDPKEGDPRVGRATEADRGEASDVVRRGVRNVSREALPSDAVRFFVLAGMLERDRLHVQGAQMIGFERHASMYVHTTGDELKTGIVRELDSRALHRHHRYMPTRFH